MASLSVKSKRSVNIRCTAGQGLVIKDGNGHAGGNVRTVGGRTIQ